MIGSLAATVVGIGCNNFGSRIDDKRTEKGVTADHQGSKRVFQRV